jgi:hypothetical protein
MSSKSQMFEVSAVTTATHNSMFELREIFHQMCQPMTTLLWMLELAQMQEGDDLKRRMLKDALSESRRLVGGIHAAREILARDLVVSPKEKVVRQQ